MTEKTIGSWKTTKILLLVSVIVAAGGIACNRLPNFDSEVQNREVVDADGPSFASLLEERFAGGEVVAIPPRGRL